MTPYSYRKIQIFAILLTVVLTLALPAVGQYGKSSEAVLRGTAVLESGQGGWRLIPVCIFSAGKFYDADFYQSTPVPMSLIDGTIYEVQKSGMPVGTFNVNNVVRSGAVWYGLGNYVDFADTAKHESSKAKGSVDLKDGGSDDRPVLKRSTPAPAPAAAAPATPSPDDAKMANSDPDRPVLKRGTQAPPPAVAGPNEDPTARAERIRRSKQLNVAVSDPSTRTTRPFVYEWDDQQKHQLAEAMAKLAAKELSKVAKARGITLGPKDKIEFTDSAISAYDVDYSNNPQLVYTAKYIPSTRQLAGLSEADASEVMRGGVYVTAVARVNYNAELERIFAEVSDPRDLNTYPRMEFVDAVDVDSDNRAELLFAKLTENGRRFSVYRLYGLQMNELFTSGLR
jgi:hypothetical protein